MNADRQILWNRDFVLILRICTIATFPNSILNDRVGLKKMEMGLSR